MNIKPEDLRELPIKKASIKKQERFSRLVDRMLSLNNRLIEMHLTDERAMLKEVIRKTDYAIDEFVYEIYGLAEADKKTIEDSFK